MRSLVGEHRISIIEFIDLNSDTTIIKPNTFIFNLIRDKKVYRAIRVTVVESLGLYDAGSFTVDYGIHSLHRFKWEELDTTDYTKVVSLNYLDVNDVKKTLTTWICDTELIVGKDTIIKLSKEEAERIFNDLIWKIHDNLLYTPDCDMLIIRDEI